MRPHRKTKSLIFELMYIYIYIYRSLKRLPEPTELQSHQKDPLEISSPNLDMWRIINVKKVEGRTTSDVVVKTVKKL